ncbi:hypothetical protein C8R45DRAFT_1099749 [Mycena sanguinolenta]|nr:hypothetical protein C8R45DRAFT_1099749 [Mycena sanguinolenta]
MFTAASEFKINGGNFYDISGDMNLNGGRQPAILRGNPLIGLEFGLNNASSREVVLGERHGREDEASRVAPSDLDDRVPLSNIIIGGNVNQIQHGERGLHILHRATAGDAFHNSAERYPQPKCHPETRTGMLDDLWDWSSNTHPDTALWLYGPAGAGKSAIAQTFCQMLEAGNCLGASFFFKRGNSSRGTGNKLFPTLAYQLAVSLPELKTTISRVVEDDPSIMDRTLSIQLQKLIIDPCRQTACSRTLVVVIDGLDECEGKEIQREILRSIGSAIRQGPLSLRFFIASRPEPHIREIFTDALPGIHRALNINQSFDDTTMAGVIGPWPSLEVVEYVVQKSSGYFIYASTVIKFIDDEDFRPTERLKVILGTREIDDESPFAALDQLYMQILSQIPARTRLLRILTVVAAKLHLSLGHIEQLLGLEPGDVRLTLRGLQSVIGAGSLFNLFPVSDGDTWSSESCLVVHHASFYDFLQDPRRAGIFYVGTDSCKMDLASCILEAFSYGPTKSSKDLGR